MKKDFKTLGVAVDRALASGDIDRIDKALHHLIANANATKHENDQNAYKRHEQESTPAGSK